MDFSFPALPKPKPLSKDTGLQPQNPLLAGATVRDRSSGAAGCGGTAQPPAAAADQQQQQQGVMGVAPSRHQRIAPARKKVPFEKGFSQMDWVRLTQTHPDLAGLGGQRSRRGITMEEVAQHRTEDDCWTVLRGKVYNLTHYLRFHPGGVPLLLKVAGRDGTALFNKYHAWVNYDFLLAKCLVGLLAPPSAAGGEAGEPPAAAAPAAPAAADREPAAAAPAAAAAAPAPGAAEGGLGGGNGGGGSNSSSSTDLQQVQPHVEDGGAI